MTARGAGLADEVGGRWRATEKGRALARRVRREADAHLATLAPAPPADLVRLASTLGAALASLEGSDLPRDHMARTHRFVGDPSIPMVALENALFALWMARDDAHMASWREAGFDGPTFDVLTRVWRREATSVDDLATKLAQQRPADVRAGLGRLREAGLVDPAAIICTDRGAAARSAVEDDTDRRFFRPWPELIGADVSWIRDRLAAVNRALLPTS